jgi:predicted transcriptional regulator
MKTQTSGGHGEKKYFRIRLRLHYTWFLAFIFIISVVATQFPEAYSFWRRLLLGVVTALIFLIMIIIRQLAVNFIAHRRNIMYRRVTLYIFGGVPGITREYTSPVLEILLGSAGLMFSLLVTILFYLFYVALVVAGNVMLGSLLSWLTFVFSLLTVFHFIPAYPLDGGRILRGLIWRATGDYDRATRISTWVGEGIALACIAGGLLVLFLNQQWLFGITLVFSGWVLNRSTAQINRLTLMRRTLRNVAVSAIMSREYPHVTPQMSVAQLIRDYSLVTGQYYFPVVSDDKLLGSVTLQSIKSVPKKLRNSTTVAKIMTPARNLIVAHTNQSAADAYEQMVEMDFDEMPVMEGDRVVGAVFQDKLTHLAKVKTELRM